MSRGRGEVQNADDARLSNAYRESVGAVLTARKQYDEACADHGPASPAATQAQESLAREIAHRDELRTEYDRVLDQG